MKDIFLKINFLVNTIVRIVIPPIYSFKRLEKYCKAQVEKHPKLYLPRWFLAELYKNNKKYEKARKEYAELERMGYLKKKDLLDYGDILFKLEDYKGVVDIIFLNFHKAYT